MRMEIFMSLLDLFRSNPKTKDLVIESGPMSPINEEMRDLGYNTYTEAGRKAAIQFLSAVPEIKEAFTQADIELALDDRGWLVGGKRMAGELDPMSRQVQVNRSRYYAIRDPLAKQAVRLWTDYAFGADAVTWSSDEDGVQSKLDKFMKDRRNRKITSRFGMRRMSHRLLIDGEIFFAIFEDGTIRFFDCLQITDIICDPDDDDTVYAYKRVTTGQYGAAPQTLYYKPWDWEEDNFSSIPVDPATKKDITFEDGVVIYHVAFDAFEKRGQTLLGACSDWSREHRRFMEARVALTQALSRFAYKGKVKGGQNVINALQSQLQSTFAKTGLNGGTEHNPQNSPGGVWAQNDGVDLTPMPRTTGASDASADANGLKLMVSAGTGIMLHYFGDPSTGNLATATAMELPMLKMFGAYQQLWKDAWRDIFSIILEEDADEEPEVINITMPDIIEDDLQKMSMILQQITTIFPEAKVPEVLEMILSSMGVQNLPEVMEKIAAQKEENDAKAAQDAQQQQQNALALASAKRGTEKENDGPMDGGPVGTNTDTTESEQIRCLTEALNQLASKL
jgi:hypothetical protein